MFDVKVGFVTENEKKVLMELHERGLGLQELLLELDSPLSDMPQSKKDDIREKIIKDDAETKLKLRDYWLELARKYQWKRNDNGYWQIDFSTNDIYLRCRNDHECMM